MNLPKDKVISNVENYGNTSAASIPILLSELHEANKLKENQLIVTAGFGAGFTWGVNIIKWQSMNKLN